MVKVEIEQGVLTLTFDLFYRLLTFTRTLRVPLNHIDGVGPGDAELRTRRQFQMPGVWAPGMIMAGIFINEEGRTLWDVHNIDKAVAIYFNDESFLAAVVEVEDPDAMIGLITRAVALHRGGSV